MELFKEILAKALESATVRVEIVGLDIARIVEAECYRALSKIRAAVGNSALDDHDCFERVEEIIAALEDTGSNGGSRHDF